MGIEYFRMVDFAGSTTDRLSEIPTPFWWALGIGLAIVVYWSLRR